MSSKSLNPAPFNPTPRGAIECVKGLYKQNIDESAHAQPCSLTPKRARVLERVAKSQIAPEGLGFQKSNFVQIDDPEKVATSWSLAWKLQTVGQISSGRVLVINTRAQ